MATCWSVQWKHIDLLQNLIHDGCSRMCLPQPLSPPLSSTDPGAARCMSSPGAALHCTALQCTALHCTALHCTALQCNALYCTALNFTTLHWTDLHRTALHCTAVVFLTAGHGVKWLSVAVILTCLLGYTSADADDIDDMDIDDLAEMMEMFEDLSPKKEFKPIIEPNVGDSLAREILWVSLALTYLNWISYELDGVGPVDNRPFTTKLHHFVQKKTKKKWDMWHVTRDMWHVTRDTWHIWGGEHSLKISAP